jgi:flagellar basal-body rod modification protein FlgD
MTLDAKPAGALPITWNGADDAGQPTPAGTYSVSVTAKDANGQSVNVSQSVTGTVAKVSFDHGYPELTLSTGAVAPVSQLVSVGAAPASP